MIRALGVVLALAACQKDKPKQITVMPEPGRDAAPGLIVAAADAAVPVDAADPTLRWVKQSAQPGPYVVTYNCFHSNMPFGKGSQIRNYSYDLGAGTVTVLEVIDDGEDDAPSVASKPPRPKQGARPTPAKPAPKPTVTKLPAAHVAKIAAAVDKVLHGGPYHVEWPVPEGTPCQLAILKPPSEILFAIDKAYTNLPDEVTELVKAFSP